MLNTFFLLHLKINSHLTFQSPSFSQNYFHSFSSLYDIVISRINSVKNVLDNVSRTRGNTRKRATWRFHRSANGIIPLRGRRVDKDLSAGVIVIGAVFPDHRRQDLRATFPCRGNKLSSLYQLRGMRASGRRKSVARKSTRGGI